MDRVGFIGLGRMGLPMATNIAKAGYALTIFNRTLSKTVALKELGVTVARSPREVAEATDVIITMLSDAPAVREVLLGPEGILSSASPGKVIIDMSTLAPKESLELANQVASRGIQMLDAPVIGSVKPATEGTLTIMVGGPHDIFVRVRPVLMTMGKRIYYVGKNGMGSTVKVAHNLLIGIFLTGLSEALILSKNAGVDPKMFIEVLLTGPLRCQLFEAKGPSMAEGVFPAATFTIQLMEKDLGLAVEFAKSLGIELPLTALVEQLYAAAKSQGMGQLDYSAIVTAMESLSRKT